MKPQPLPFLLVVGLFVSRNLVKTGAAEAAPVSIEEVLPKAIYDRPVGLYVSI
jgi:hypothetical protein